MALLALNCPNCGGTVDRDRLICEYCGTHFRDSSVVRFQIPNQNYNPPTTVLGTEVRNGREQLMIAPESVEVQAKREIAKDMARQLLEGNMIEMVSEMDWKSCEQVISARLRVLDPHYRF